MKRRFSQALEPGGFYQMDIRITRPNGEMRWIAGRAEIVRDEHGEPASGARVTALLDEKEATTVRTDANGRYTLTTRAGAQIIAGDGGKTGRATVGTANVPTEEVDVTLDSDQ
jgi:hypothetical protein